MEKEYVRQPPLLFPFLLFPSLALLANDELAPQMLRQGITHQSLRAITQAFQTDGLRLVLGNYQRFSERSFANGHSVFLTCLDNLLAFEQLQCAHWCHGLAVHIVLKLREMLRHEVCCALVLGLGYLLDSGNFALGLGLVFLIAFLFLALVASLVLVLLLLGLGGHSRDQLSRQGLGLSRALQLALS